MEEARYWMWAKRKQILSSSSESWEEQAFAEDSAGPLGGCIWPPRSYSCSFCRREFRSAQALGGHMNVHRRDRARLKQSPIPQDSTEILHHHQVCTSLYNPNSNTNTAVVVASSPSPSRVSAPTSTQGSLFSSSLVLQQQQNQQHTKGSLFSPPLAWSDSTNVRVLSVTDSKEIEGVKILNLFVHRSQPAGSGGGGEEDDVEEGEALIRKRRRSDDTSSLPSFLFKSSSVVDRHHLQSEVLGLRANSMEDLDLELRLGDGPKVK